MPNYICVRYEPIRNAANAGSRTKHGRRSGAHDLSHCDPALRPLVLAGGVKSKGIAGQRVSPFDVKSSLYAAANAANLRFRSGAAIGAELLFTASPDFFSSSPDMKIEADRSDRNHRKATFRALIDGTFTTGYLSDDDGDNAATDLPRGLRSRWSALAERVQDSACEKLTRYDPARIFDFLATVLLGCSRKPGWDIACWRLDLDEATPHLSVFVIPSYMKYTQSGVARWVSVREHFGKPEQLSDLQDWAGRICEPLGLVRGRPRTETDAEHLAPRKYRAIKKAERAAALAAESAEANRKAASAEHARNLQLREEAEHRLAEINTISAEFHLREAALELATRAIVKREANITAQSAELASAKRDHLKDVELVSQQREALDQRVADVENGVQVAATILKDSGGFDGRGVLLGSLLGAMATSVADVTSDVEKALGRWRNIAAQNSVPQRRAPESSLPEVLPGFD
ncbi:plasmid recombination protein [Aurantimonas coralicida]|uniref:plasmid recombination protein n=1 Tax=Aurantimonas coralicida TaxID=182270 RepID=UPI001E41C015|nr:plasmid recombination protein [Aurantimonas coralicida]MCD1645364.1 plasmid recombination protein [Aurantimonas coralicida]